MRGIGGRGPLLLAGTALVLHLVPQPGYELHRDELLYLAMGDHLDLFRMQFPPLIAVLARILALAAGVSVFLVRLLPALAHGALILMAASLARRFGGGARSSLLAALAVLVAPVFLRTGTLFQPVILEMVWWNAALLGLAALIGGASRRTWLVVGLFLGLGALTKFSAAFFAAGLAVGAVFTPLRRDLRTPWPWLGAALAGLLALPSLTGQLAWNWPLREQMEALREAQLGRVTPLAFIGGQLFMLAVASPLAVAGVAALATPSWRRWRPIALLVGAIFMLMLALHGKEYYFAPLLVPLLAAGAVGLQRWCSPRRWRLVSRLACAFLLLGGLVTFPLGIPLLPPESLARYSAGLGIGRAVTTNVGTRLALPQDYADMLGWREKVEAVAKVYHALPAEERAQVVILGVNYGRAGALEVYGPSLGLPRPVSPYGDFYHWGPGSLPGETVIVLGGSREGLARHFASVVEAARVRDSWAVEEEQDVPVFLCRRPYRTLQQAWPDLGPIWG